MDMINPVVLKCLEILGNTFLLAMGLLAIAVVYMFIADVTQTKDAVRRNYPVIGRFRYLFTTLGEFFRQYFFALDREEMPFNRAEREWIHRASKEGSKTVPFGSTRILDNGAPIFTNGVFPKLEGEFEQIPPLEFGPYCKAPYRTHSFFNISAMSYGSLSKPAIQALSHGAKKAECWHNTGEGGLSPYHLEGGGDVVFQMGTAKFGVRDLDGNLSDEKLREVAAHPQVKMIEVKLSQGAKPGKGGILPASKVTDEIAEIRGIKKGEDAISPNRHLDAANESELLDLVGHIRDVTGLPTGIKLCVGDPYWFEGLCKEISKRGEEAAPDFISIDGGDGGTGAAPMPLIDNMGLTIRESLPAVHSYLKKHGLRDRIKLIASGKLVTPAEVALAFCGGADAVNSARGFMFALGCIQALKCNTNRCPTGITTHDKRLQKGLDPADKADRVALYVKTMRKEVEMIAHSCGVDHPRLLTRHHVRIVGDYGKSVPLSDVWPEELSDKVMT